MVTNKIVPIHGGASESAAPSDGGTGVSPRLFLSPFQKRKVLERTPILISEGTWGWFFSLQLGILTSRKVSIQSW